MYPSQMWGGRSAFLMLAKEIVIPNNAVVSFNNFLHALDRGVGRVSYLNRTCESYHMEIHSSQNIGLDR